jgi:hypothetical protein
MECSTDIKGGANILANKEYKYHNKIGLEFDKLDITKKGLIITTLIW